MAQNYEIDIKRFNGHDYDTLLPTPASHASTHQAGGSDPLTLQTGNYGNSSIPTSAYQDSSVSRAKLANDALYSPIIIANANVTINASHCGKTLKASKSSDAKIDITITYNTSNPVGMEFAVLNIWTKRTRIVAGTNAKLLLSDGSAPSSVVVPRYGMAAAKLITRNTSTPFDQWYITGDVEVV